MTKTSVYEDVSQDIERMERKGQIANDLVPARGPERQQQIANDPVFAEFLDKKRYNLIARLISKNSILSKIPRGNAIYLWLADISILEAWEQYERGPVTILRNCLNNTPRNIAGMIAGGKKNTLKSDCEPPREGQKPQRNREIVTEALRRDKFKCVVSHSTPIVEIAQIFPFRLHKTDTSMVGDDPWSWIEMFWGAEKCAKWKSGVMNETIVDTEKLYNVMTLAYHVSGYWDKAICAFRPISLSYDQKVLEISFHWLPCISKSIKRKDRVSTLHPFGEDMDKWPQEPVKTHGIMHVCTECPIRSGEIIELTTDDPVQYPLPTMELLLMRWHMSRIVALQGAANDEDEDV